MADVVKQELSDVSSLDEQSNYYEYVSNVKYEHRKEEDDTSIWFFEENKLNEDRRMMISSEHNSVKEFIGQSTSDQVNVFTSNEENSVCTEMLGLNMNVTSTNEVLNVSCTSVDSVQISSGKLLLLLLFY